MTKLFFANLKMIVREKQVLFWSLVFPLIFVSIFGLFFGKSSNAIGTVALVNNSSSEIAKNFEKSLEDSDLFKIQKEIKLEFAQELLKKDEVTSIVFVPEDFGSQKPNAPTKVKIFFDPKNAQSAQIVTSFANQFFTQINYQIQKAVPIYQVEQEKTSGRNLNYFDFVLVGLLGMALMNSSIQGVAITMARYREEKILKRVITTPLPAWKFILAEIFSRLILNLCQISIILITGIYGFGGKIYGPIWLIYLLSLAGAAVFQTIGFAIAGVTRSVRSAEGMATAITIPMMFLAGVFFPIDQLPRWLFYIAQYLPLAPLLKLLRAIGLNEENLFAYPVSFIVILLWLGAMLLLVIWKFKFSEE